MKVWSLNYRSHDLYVEPARVHPEVWRLALGLVLVAGFFLVLSQILFGALFGLMGPDIASWVALDATSGQTTVGMLVLLGQLGLLAAASAIVCVIVHKRGPSTLLGPSGLALRQFIVVAAAMALLTVALIVLPPYNSGEPLQKNMNFGRWILLLPFALVAILAQSGAEEIFFRGYIQQQLAARFRSPLVWILLPAGLFGLGHYLPDSAGSNAVTIALWAVMFGILMADLTARAGTLGPAIAVHFFNNVSAMVLVATPDQMSGLALYVLPFGVADEAQMAEWLPVDFAYMFVSWLAARFAIRA